MVAPQGRNKKDNHPGISGAFFFYLLGGSLEGINVIILL
jgi:hypothetical protein